MWGHTRSSARKAVGDLPQRLLAITGPGVGWTEFGSRAWGMADRPHRESCCPAAPIRLRSAARVHARRRPSVTTARGLQDAVEQLKRPGQPFLSSRRAWSVGVWQVAIFSDLSTVQVTPRHGPSPPGLPRSLSPLLLHWLGFSCNKVDANEGTPPVNRAHLTHGDLPDGELRCLRLEVV